MGLYNSLFGVDGRTPALVGLLGFASLYAVPRFRDAYIAGTDEKPLIAIYTRMGGGNRGCWAEKEGAPEAHAGAPTCGKECQCDCYGCRAVVLLRHHDLYVNDEDDDFDSTYATYYFNFPEEFPTSEIVPDEITPRDKWEAMIAALDKKEGE